jgi:hypothetical protein
MHQGKASGSCWFLQGEEIGGSYRENWLRGK